MIEDVFAVVNAAAAAAAVVVDVVLAGMLDASVPLVVLSEGVAAVVAVRGSAVAFVDNISSAEVIAVMATRATKADCVRCWC